MSYSYDAFGHITNRTGYYYSSQDTTSYYFNAATDRNASWNYDADGNTLTDGDAAYTYDAAGKLVKTSVPDPNNSPQYFPPTEDYFNGDGQLEKRVRNSGSTTTPLEVKNYYIRSSVLNKVISETDKTGKKLNTFVPANGITLATQTIYRHTSTPTESLTFNHTDATNTGVQQTNATGALIGDTNNGRTGEYSPLGKNIANLAPYTIIGTYEPPDESGVNLFGSGGGYRPGKMDFTLFGIPVPESVFMAELDSGLIGGIFGLVEAHLRIRGLESFDNGVYIGEPAGRTILPDEYDERGNFNNNEGWRNLLGYAMQSQKA